MSGQTHEFATRSGIGSVRAARPSASEVAPLSPWTAGRIAELRAFKAAGVPNRQIADAFGMTISSVEHAIRRYGFVRLHQQVTTRDERRRAYDAKVRAEYVPPMIEVEKAAKKIDRRCLNCKREFQASTRFIRLCHGCKIS